MSKCLLFSVACSLGLGCVADDEFDEDVELRAADLEREGDLYVALDGPVVEKARFQIAEKDGVVEYELKTTGMPPGEVVTVWLAGFNKPWNCNGGGPLAHGEGQCGLIDWISPETYADTGVFWKLANGEIIASDGKLKFKTIDDPDQPTEFGPQLDFENAEIHIWVRTHGPPIPGRLEEQLTYSLGGCDVNPCVDLQIAVF